MCVFQIFRRVYPNRISPGDLPKEGPPPTHFNYTQEDRGVKSSSGILHSFLRKKVWRLLAVVGICAPLVLTTGCFGSFPLSSEIYGMNTNVSRDKFNRTIVYWALLLTLAYPSVFVTDLLILNTIEYWNGTPTPDNGWRFSQADPYSGYEQFEAAILEPSERAALPGRLTALSEVARRETPIGAPIEAPIKNAVGTN